MEFALIANISCYGWWRMRLHCILNESSDKFHIYSTWSGAWYLISAFCTWSYIFGQLCLQSGKFGRAIFRYNLFPIRGTWSHDDDDDDDNDADDVSTASRENKADMPPSLTETTSRYLL